MSTPIARYFASLSFQVDKKQLKEIDRTLLNIENKLKAFQRRIGSALKLSLKVDKIDIDQKRLNIASQEAVKKASQNTIFEVTRFAVNDRNLQAAMMRAGRMIGQRVGGPTPQQPVPQAVSPVVQQQPRQNIVSGRSHYLHAGGAAGAFVRYGVESLPFLGGAYGLSQVNSISQELQANQLALRAVAGPNAGMYQEYLNNLGNRLGMTTRALQPSFTQYLANAQGTALEPTLTRDFESFTQYGAVMGLSQEEMKGSLKAITQMVSKQQIYAEELRGQLAERMPAAVRLMAEAVTGGDTKALIEMMAEGKLDPNKVLPKFFEQMRGISEPMLPEYFKSSRFAQGSMNKAVEDQIQNFAKTGGDEAFTRFFRLMAEAIRGAQPLITGLAGAFNRLTIALQAPVTLFKNLNMVLAEMSNLSGISEGKIVSLAAAGALLTTKWGRVFALFSGVAMVLEDISFGLQGKNSYTKDFLDFLEGKGVVMNEFEKGLFGVSAAMLAVAAAIKAVSAATSLPGVGDVFGDSKGGKGARGGWLNKLIPFIGAAGVAAGATIAGVNAYTAPGASLDEMSKNPYSPFYKNQMNINQAGFMVRDFSSGNPYYDDPKGVEQWFKDVARAKTQDYMLSNTQKYGTALPGVTPMQVNVEVKADIKAQNAEEFAAQLTEKVKTTLNAEIGKALIMMPQKE